MVKCIVNPTEIQDSGATPNETKYVDQKRLCYTITYGTSISCEAKRLCFLHSTERDIPLFLTLDSLLPPHDETQSEIQESRYPQFPLGGGEINSSSAPTLHLATSTGQANFITYNSGCGIFLLWDTIHGMHRIPYTMEGDILNTIVAISAQVRGNTLIAACSDQETVQIFNHSTTAVQFKFRPGNPVSALRFDNSAGNLACGGIDGGISIFAIAKHGGDIQIGMEIELFDRYSGSISRLQYHANSVQLCSLHRPSSVKVFHHVKLWDCHSGAKLWEFGNGSVISAELHPRVENKLLVRCNSGNEFGEMDINVSLDTLDSFDTVHDIMCCAYSPDGQFALTAHDFPYQLKVWKLESRELVHTVELECQPYMMWVWKTKCFVLMQDWICLIDFELEGKCFGF